MIKKSILLLVFAAHVLQGMQQDQGEKKKKVAEQQQKKRDQEKFAHMKRQLVRQYIKECKQVDSEFIAQGYFDSPCFPVDGGGRLMDNYESWQERIEWLLDYESSN